MNDCAPYVIENPYIARRLREIHADMRKRGMIKDDPRISKDDQFIATLIALYEAQKELLTKLGE